MTSAAQIIRSFRTVFSGNTTGRRRRGGRGPGQVSLESLESRLLLAAETLLVTRAAIPGKPIVTEPQGSTNSSFPTFVWTAPADAAFYSIWVTNTATDTRVIYRTGYRETSYQHFSPLPDGNYRVWVQAFNRDGFGGPWSDPVQFSVDAPVPAAPSITAPAAVTTSTTPAIQWTAVAHAWKYDLWVNYRTGGVNQIIRQQNIQGTTSFVPSSALPQGDYVAWVRAINGNQEAGPWSAPRTFTIDVPTPAKTVMTAPAGVAGSSVVITQNPTFAWNAVEWGSTYDLWVNNESTGQAQVIRNQAIPTTSYTAETKLPEGSYRAWVRAKNSVGEVGQWSDPFSFSISIPLPSVPVVTGPQPNPAGSVETSTPTLTWDAGAVPGSTYELRINNSTTGETEVIRVNNIAEKSYTIRADQRLNEHTYTAFVRAVNSTGKFSAWSQAFVFRIDVPNPATPRIIAPGGVTLATGRPTFEWSHDGGTVRYEILVRDLEHREDIVFQVQSLNLSPSGSSAFYTPTESQALGTGTYRFWIRGFNSQGTASAWSNSSTFAVAAVSPLDGLQLTSAVHRDAAEQPADSDSAVAIPPATIPPAAEPQTVRVKAVATTPGKETTPQSPGDPAISTRAESGDIVLTEAVMAEIADPASVEAGEILTSSLTTVRQEGLPASLSSAAAVLSVVPFTVPRRRRTLED